jgi:NitT/TauT family transport system ATP-binding protein
MRRRADGVDAALEFSEIRHAFPDPAGGVREVLAGIGFAVEANGFTAIVGPSGCGKSTLLGFAAGLLAPSAGEVRQSGERVRGINRRVGLVPQHSGLFPWKTLAENVAFPLVVRDVPEAERRRRVAAVLEQVGLTGFEGHYPHQLSGGMQKRAAIARTLVYAPEVMLMDEPFGALDAQTRMTLQDDLQRLWATQRATILFVTHDLAEAILLADTVVLLTRPPTRIKGVVRIALPRPRDVFEPFRNPGWAESYEQVWSLFRSEVGRA